jgi:zinc/manganese transport system substrate-binding protein
MSASRMLAVVLTAFLFLLPLAGRGEIKVVTSLPDLADLARHVGGDRISVDNIVRGDQNPHFIEVKPSYMMKLRSAHMFLTIGLDLELWAQQLVDGSRNSSLQVVDCSRGVEKLEVPARVDASQGDVHRFGNPHYWLDPRNARPMVAEIVRAFSAASPADAPVFQSNGEAYLRTLERKIAEWESLMKPLRETQIVTFHRSWSYFAAWLGLRVVGEVEPKPGIVPSPGHTAELITRVRQSRIRAIIVEPFYDPSAAEQIARATGAQVLRLPTSVGGTSEAVDYISLIDHNVRTLAKVLR